MGSESSLIVMGFPAVAVDPASLALGLDQPLEPVVEWLGILEQRGVDVSSVPAPSVDFFSRSLRFVSPQEAAGIVHDFLESARRFPTGREQGLPEKQRAVVRLRLQGFPYKRVAHELGLTGPGAHRRMKAALPFLEEATIERLDRLNDLSFQRPTPQERAKIIALKREGLSLREIAGRLGRDKDLVGHVLHEAFPGEHFPTSQPDLERGKRIVEAFWANWNQRLLPGGDFIIKIARQFGVSTKTVDFALKMAGVDVKNEAKKKRLLFMLEVARSMNEPFYETRERLRVSKNTLISYRRYIRQGLHLKWATELARTSNVDWWWDTSFVGAGKVNMGLRNRTFLKRLKLLDDAIAKAGRLKTLYDLREDRGTPRYEEVCLELKELQDRREKEIAQERQFREKYQLPSMDILKGGEA